MQKSLYSDYYIVNIQQNFPKLSANVYVFKRYRPRGMSLCEKQVFIFTFLTEKQIMDVYKQ